MPESRAGVRASEISFFFTFPAWRTVFFLTPASVMVTLNLTWPGTHTEISVVISLVTEHPGQHSAGAEGAPYRLSV